MKKFFAIVFFALISLALSATSVDLSLTGVATGTHFYYCSTTVDSVIVYLPASATPGAVQWNNGTGIIIADSIIVTPTTQGYWDCQYGPTSIIEFYVNFVSISPTEPWTVSNTTKCTEATVVLDAQAVPQADFVYSWNTGAITQQIAALTPGIYTVTITGACGVVDDQIEVLNYPVPAPDLGPDVVTCDGNTVTLDPGIFNGYAWSTTNVTPTIDVTTPGTYAVEVTDANGCVASDTIDVNFVFAPAIEICYVEFDTITHKNRIVWAAAPENADDINIYSEISTDVYSLIGSVPASQTSFIDMNSNPQNMSYSYKISISDTCENEGSQSEYHKTITLLSAYDQPTNTYGFTWSAYEGISVANYYIYGINASNAVFQIASVPGNTYFYNYSNPSPTFVKYFVGFYTEDCGAKSEYMVKSNLVNSTTTTLLDSQQNANFSIYPNPATSQINIITDQIITEITVYSITGQEMLKLNNTKTVDVSGLAAGNYSLKIVAERGVVVERVVVE
ncbi:MAG: T9SS type A sorting domain-containing protein [Bacteroidales bacterium]|nr:T9SS type A sorting domain-containing protein [Bacteroidales bacterium]